MSGVVNVFDASKTPAGAQATTVKTAAQNAVVGYAIRRLAAQPWWKKSSNTVMTVISGLAVLAWWLTSTGVGLPAWLTYLVGAFAVVGQGVIAKATKNGFTNTGAADLQYAVQDHSVLAAIWQQVQEQGFPAHPGVTEQQLMERAQGAVSDLADGAGHLGEVLPEARVAVENAADEARVWVQDRISRGQ